MIVLGSILLSISMMLLVLSFKVLISNTKESITKKGLSYDVRTGEIVVTEYKDYK